MKLVVKGEIGRMWSSVRIVLDKKRRDFEVVRYNCLIWKCCFFKRIGKSKDGRVLWSFYW